MIWDILQTKLEAAGLVSEAQGSFFVEEMPADVRIGVMLRAPLSGILIDPHLPGYYRTKLQVIVRHIDPVEGARLADAVQKTLEVQAVEKHEATPERGEVQINLFQPIALPIRYPRLEGGTIEWSLNYEASFTLPR